MEGTELTPDQIAEFERESAAADAQLASSGSITTEACLFEVAELAGTFSLCQSFDGDEWIRGFVGGFAMGGSVVWGKLTVSDSVNREGYSGSCAIVKVAILAAYTHVTGYDDNSNAVFKFDGGGYGIGFFSGGGRFTIKKPVS